MGSKVIATCTNKNVTLCTNSKSLRLSNNMTCCYSGLCSFIPSSFSESICDILKVYPYHSKSRNLKFKVPVSKFIMIRRQSVLVPMYEK